jgi:hypothetical protein
MRIGTGSSVFLALFTGLLIFSPRVCAAAGWHLMGPPTSGELDTSCANGALPAVRDFLAALMRWDNLGDIQMRRCDLERKTVDLNAPLWQWNQNSEFETLDDCHVGYRQAQEHKRLDEALSKVVAELELHDEGNSKPSDDELKLRIESAKAAVDIQISAARCIATDDPRLQRPSIF